MIHELEIPKPNWTNFLNTLNRQAADRPVRLEVIERELGDQEMADLQPLREIDFETKGSARGALLITVGSDRGELTHRIDRPTRFYIAHTQTGETESLAIQDESGGETVVYFENLPALPKEATGQHAA
jgi:hypothetical protein